ncbi:MAG: HNH endonuclease [Verrucomicrobia bacterium]|nr:MAG: HNH endonuclease [Verrucomicrobiota bacterium]
MNKLEFENYLNEDNIAGSGKASSYIKALDWLSQMLKIESYGFMDCLDIWSVSKPDRLFELRSFVLEEQKKSVSPWITKTIPISYLRDGYCAAALSQLIQFLPQKVYTNKILKIYDSCSDDEQELKSRLNQAPDDLDFLVHDPKSKDGMDRIREVKTRVGQRAFRIMVMRNYQNTCCITGLNIPILNRASHIIGWAERIETRMLPSNGLCLSATYDAAFDKKLISLDEQYRLILSKDIKDCYSNQCVQTYFQSREGQTIAYPTRSKPNQQFLDIHRKAGNF